MKRTLIGAALGLAMSLVASGQATDNVKRNHEVIRQHHERLNRGDVQAAILDYAEDTKIMVAL